MTKDTFGKVMTFLDKLEQSKISYTLAHHRDEALMVNVAVPGERWEIEFLRDGSVEVERFSSDGEIYDEESLVELFDKNSDFNEKEDDLALAQGIELMSMVDES
jgi:hypothetical protein